MFLNHLKLPYEFLYIYVYIYLSIILRNKFILHSESDFSYKMCDMTYLVNLVMSRVSEPSAGMQISQLHNKECMSWPVERVLKQ